MKPRICFYSLYCYPLFNSECQAPFGGWETRISLIAKELARRGNFDVTVIVGDYGQAPVEYRQGVRLLVWVGRKMIPVSEIDPPAPGAWSTAGLGRLQSVRFNTGVLALAKRLLRKILHPVKELLIAIKKNRDTYAVLDRSGQHIVWRDEIKILDLADADLYVVPGNHHMSAVMAFYCRVRKKKYVFLSGSDYDYSPDYKLSPNAIDIYGEAYYEKVFAIEGSDLHIVQSPQQAKLLEAGYGRSGVVIRNPIDLSSSRPRSSNPDTILWVGKTDERVKRPSWFFSLARRLPEQKFVAIMNKYDEESFAACLETARSLPNLTLIEKVPFEEVEKYFAEARLFVNTSVFEGFPNTFLQAAKYGVPIIASDVDPAGMLSQHGCGVTCGGDFEILVQSVQRILADERLYSATCQAVLVYVKTQHDKELVISQYERAFRNLLDTSAGKTEE